MSSELRPIFTFFSHLFYEILDYEFSKRLEGKNSTENGRIGTGACIALTNLT